MKPYTEQDIINMIVKRFKGGIGDDAAAVDIPKDFQLLVTCDTQVEGVHFKKKWMSPLEIGQRSVAVAVSDIAAMGGVAKYILVSLMLPGTEQSFVDQLFNGIERACRAYDIALIGGNLSTAEQIIVDVTVLGVAKKSQIAKRFGAKPGDLVCVTGSLGDAGAGLRALKFKVQNSKFKVTIGRFINPTPRLKEGVLIAKYATAMIDISDGLVKDLGHICEASGVGVRLFEEKIPTSKVLATLSLRVPRLTRPRQSQYDKRDCFVNTRNDKIEMAFYGGEDYELCFTVKVKDVDKVRSQVKNQTGTDVTIIGEIQEKSKGRILVRKDGKDEKLLIKGWDHFG